MRHAKCVYSYNDAAQSSPKPKKIGLGDSFVCGFVPRCRTLFFLTMIPARLVTPPQYEGGGSPRSGLFDKARRRRQGRRGWARPSATDGLLFLFAQAGSSASKPASECEHFAPRKHCRPARLERVAALACLLTHSPSLHLPQAALGSFPRAAGAPSLYNKIRACKIYARGI